MEWRNGMNAVATPGRRTPVDDKNIHWWFLRWILGNPYGFIDIRRAEFRLKASKGTSPFDTDWKSFTHDIDHAAKVVKAQSKDGYDVYVRLTRQKKESGDKASAYSCEAVTVDMDTQESHEPEQTPFVTKGDAANFLAARVTDGSVPMPSVVLDTGYGLKAVWFLDDRLDMTASSMRDRVDAVMKRLADILQGDKGNAFCTAPCRVPGTMNYKGDKPAPVKLYDDAAWNLEDYDFSSLEELVGAEVPVRAPMATGTIEAMDELKLPQRTLDLLEDEVPKGERSEVAFSIMQSMLRAGATDDLIADAVEAAPVGEHYADTRHLRDDIERARQKAQTEPPLLLSIGTSIDRDEAARLRESALETDEKTGRSKLHAQAAAKAFLEATQGNVCFQDNCVGESLSSSDESGVFRYWSGTHWRPYHILPLDADLVKLFGQAASPRRVQSEIQHSLRVGSRKGRDEFDADKGLLFFGNGTLNPVTGRFKTHDRDNLNTFVVPVDYDSKANCPKWEAFMRSVIGSYDVSGNWDHEPTAAAVLQEYIGYALQPSCRYENMMFLDGPGSNGKSMFIETVVELFGRHTLAVGFHFSDFAEKFRLGELEGKLLAYHPDEAGSTADRVDSVIKSFVSGETLTCERKYDRPYPFTNHAKGLWGFNNAPTFGDQSQAIQRRLLVVPFNKDFENRSRKERRDRDVLKKELARELPGILNWGVAGLRRLSQNGKFTKSSLVNDAVQAVLHSHDPLRQFVDECCTIKDGERVQIKAFYDAYVDWCIEQGIESRYRKKRRNISTEVTKRFPTVQRSGKIRGVFYLTNLKVK